jgi:ribonuclease Z
VQTVVRRDLIEMIGLPRLTDVLDYHSSVPQAAETAVRNGVGTLVLTHLVPPPAAGTEQDWLDQTERFHGEVVLAHDLLTLDLGAGSAALSG